MPNTDDPKDPQDNDTRQTIKPDAEHSYGFDNISVSEQPKESPAAGELAHLKAEVGRLKERLSAVEAALAELKQGPGGTAEGKAR